MVSVILHLRLAWRRLLRSPDFLVASVLTLALGIGGSTAVFSLVHAVLLRPLPFPASNSVVFFHWSSQDGVTNLSSAAKFQFWQERSQQLESLAAFEILSSGATLLGGGEPDHVQSLKVSGQFFQTLGVVPPKGRAFRVEDEDPGAPGVAILTHGLWQRAFGGDREVLGKQIHLDDQAYAVVGVLPPEFHFKPDAQIWLPLKTRADDPQGEANVYGLIGRLRSERGEAQAQAEADGLFTAFREQYPTATTGEIGVVLGSLQDQLIGDLTPNLLLLLGAGILVLLICCLNLTHLAVARAIRHIGETATRLALGASRRDIAKVVASELFLIGTLAAGAGWVLAKVLVPAMLALRPESVPPVAVVRVGWAEALAAGIAALVAVLLAALVPALRINRGDLHSRLRALSAGAGAPATHHLGGLLVAIQVALSLALLSSACGLFQSFLSIMSRDPGFAVERVVTFEVPLQTERYRTTRATWQFSESLLELLRQTPTVAAAATVSSLPLETGLNVPLTVEGLDPDPAAALEVELRPVSSDYFESLAIPLLRGRSLTQQDGPETLPVAVINETLAHKVGSDLGQALDQTLWIAKGMGPLSDRPRRVVGIAADIRDDELAGPPRPTVYVPLGQIPDAMTEIIHQAFPLHVLVRRESSGPLPDFRSILREVDPGRALASVRTMEDVVRGSVLEERFYTALVALFSVLAIALTTLGLYGLLSLHVSAKRREIGLRVAIGARDGQIFKLVASESLRLLALGVVLGSALAYGLERILAHVIPEAEFNLLYVLGMGIVILLAATAAATYAPTRSALKVDPAVVLRAESAP